MRKGFIILGNHRSGTSSVTRAVALMGAALPARLMSAKADNPYGFWESQPVVSFNNRLLARAQRQWDDPKPIADAFFAQRHRSSDIAEARALIEREFGDAECFVLKDPRLARLLPIWLPALEAAGVEPAVLLVGRNPLEIVQSLQVRNGITPQQAQNLCLTSLLASERHTRNHLRSVVHYDRILADWRRELTRAYHELHHDALELSGEQADAVDAHLKHEARHWSYTTDELIQSREIATALKHLYFDWRQSGTSAEWDRGLWDRVGAEHAAAWRLLSPGPEASVDETRAIQTPCASSQAAGSETARQPQRRIVLHYHLFKNAGSSIDHILARNFPETWHEAEGPAPGWKPQEIAAYLRDNPWIEALSSHTALLPPPELECAEIFAFLFLRHPLDRIRSIYQFERKQRADTDGARKAKETDLAGYVQWRLNRKGDRAIQNFQCYRLSGAVSDSRPEVDRALAALEQLPLVGVVEQFDQSIQLLEHKLRSWYPDIQLEAVHRNVTQGGDSSLDDRLQALHDALGADLYREIEQANRDDLTLHGEARALLDRCHEQTLFF